ncbi:MAG TPA: ribonuclease III [Geminicoccus sp.]|nr:ribonuclease III [Geminicoccus sp.]
MTSGAERARAAAEAALGHAFSDPRLLDQALGHSGRLQGRSDGSAVPSHERLEFLGDRVLGLVVAATLVELYPRDAEGALSLRLVALVRSETLAEIGGALGVGDWLREAEGDAGLPVTPAVLADTVEALIAALYLDGGLPAAGAFVRRHWTPLLDRDPRPPRDAKTTLQEWTQARSLGLPAYRLVATEGPDHAPQFEVEVAVAGNQPTAGQGTTKRAAEQMAAERLLEKLGVSRHG